MKLHLIMFPVALMGFGVMKKDTLPLTSAAWTNHTEEEQLVKNVLLERSWLSLAQGDSLLGLWGHRRESLMGDGTDHLLRLIQPFAWSHMV